VIHQHVETREKRRALDRHVVGRALDEKCSVVVVCVNQMMAHNIKLLLHQTLPSTL
jgi:hypothetical protein